MEENHLTVSESKGLIASQQAEKGTHTRTHWMNHSETAKHSNTPFKHTLNHLSERHAALKFVHKNMHWIY